MSGNKKLIYAALFAALCCVITMYPKFPTLFGYIHAGDALVLLAAYVLGPVWGSLAAALGSSLADLMAGYVQYFPGTFVIKAVMALIAGAVLTKFGAKHPIRYAMLGGLAAECVMILGYFGYEGWIGLRLGCRSQHPDEHRAGRVRRCCIYGSFCRPAQNSICQARARHRLSAKPGQALKPRRNTAEKR